MRIAACFTLISVFAGFLCAAEPTATSGWSKIESGHAGTSEGAMLVAVPDLGKLYLVGPGKKAFIQAFDPVKKTWTDVSAVGPTKKQPIHPYYQTAYDPGSKTIYCLSGDSILYAFHTVDKTWKTLPPAPELDGLSWQALACDPAGKRLVVVGSDKKIDNLGWLRTVVLDLNTGKWSRLEVDPGVAKEHQALIAANEALIDLGGRIRLAWYRDPVGVGSDTERKSLQDRCLALRKRPALAKHTADLDNVAELLAGRKTLASLRAVRALQRKVEEQAEAQFPVPCARRNAPLVHDAKNKVFVLFGGDHEDYLMNDTWLLDLEKRTWRRAKPERSPSPRAGHALVYLPRAGKVALYEGYVQSNSTDYGARPWTPVGPIQLWLYDVARERWDLAGDWPLPMKGQDVLPGPVGHFEGYASQWFAPPALEADSKDTLYLVAHAGRDRKESATWTLSIDPARSDPAGTTKLGTKPDQRLYRTGPFRAEYCEIDERGSGNDLDKLPANRWVKLPAAPRNPCRGCRGRDWGTSIWDPDREQILLWGGGHCVRSASTVTHYSPVSGRMAEGFDADEPYGANGGGGFDSSLLNRPWVSTHNYKHYAYDPISKLMVSGRGYLYDPARMDWLRLEPLPLPYRFEWSHTALATSKHGVVAWARKKQGEDAGLWLFDHQKGWLDLEPKGKLFVPYCDSHGLVYDARRDRMILSGVGGGYNKVSDGSLLGFNFADKSLQLIKPDNAELARTGCARELVYVEHADWVLIGDHVRRGDPKTGKQYTRVYDCARNKMFLLDAGSAPDGYGCGWMYDARRKLVYAFTTNGEAWALRVVLDEARLLERPPE
ncbi:MAG: kelch repeat-containing protein [Gemmataceae bacterium]